MPLGPGAKLGPYEVLGPLGAGGMGEVYRARDPRLGREVAIKVLPAAVADDPERLARFRREAHVLASLNHPSIAAIYGLEEADGKPFLVLELVEGETLQERATRGRIPVDEALKIARQVAEALEEAHEHGIVHRDLKPANVKLTAEGKVKVLDFGLAKAYGGEGGGDTADVSHSPTLTRMGTEAGVILGTAAYMSPEQARGKRVDRRADIWAFGVVLFEMLTGQRLFHGETVSDTLAAVLKTDPDWSLLPAETPGRVRELLRRCLNRDPHERLRDIGDARLELGFALSGSEGPEATAGSRPVWAVGSLAAALGFALAAALLWGLGSRREPAPLARPVSRVSIVLPAEAPLWVGWTPSFNLAISRDGRQVAYVARGNVNSGLYLRRLDDLAARALPETEGAVSPFFSPDGEWIGFFTADGMLKKVALAGGRPVVLARDLSNSEWMLGSWSDDGRIVFHAPPSAGLRVVPAAGGPVTTLTTTSGEGHGDPQVLPGSDVVLGVAQARIEALSLDGTKRTTILDNASRPRYLASGHLLFMRDGGLMIAPFDKGRLELTGPAVPLPLEVAVDHPNPRNPMPQLAVALDGTLVYVPVAPGSLRSSSLVWVDRRGAVEEVARLPFAAPHFAVSPDGSRVAVTGRESGAARIDLHDLSRGTAMRLVDRDVDWPAGLVFSPDGRRLFFGSWGSQQGEILSLPFDGSSGAERILNLPGAVFTPASVSPDGRFIAFYVFDLKTAQDVWIADLQASEGGRARPFLNTRYGEWGPAFSPDGRFLAYVSNEAGGESSIYVQRFPEGDWKARVSPESGEGPQWAPDGSELFYQSPDGRKLFAVSVRRDRGLSFGAPRVLFEGPYLASVDAGLSYAVSPDARRFLMTRQPTVWPQRASELIVVQNWFEDVRRLTAASR